MFVLPEKSPGQAAPVMSWCYSQRPVQWLLILLTYILIMFRSLGLFAAGVPWQHAKNDRQRGEISLQAEEVSLPDGQGEEFQRMEDKAQVSHAAEEKMDSNSDEQEMAGDSFFRTVDVMRNGVSAGGRQEAQLTVPYTVVERFQEPMNRPMRALGFSPGGKFYATGTNSGDLCIFDMPEFRRRSAQPHSHR